ncbi:MAG: hypothetical protein IKD76_00180 [Clostridia bacterium]|nr:hypothetical protein [Clostridia bacterium]
MSGCNNLNTSNDSQSLVNKINTEIEYVDGELISVVNELNNIDYTKYKIEVQKGENKSSSSGSEQSSGGSGAQGNSENGSSEEGASSSETQNEAEEGETKKSSPGGGQEEGSKSSKGSESGKQTFSMKSNNILGSEPKVDWNKLISRVENLYTSWTTIARDLEKVGVPTEQLSGFVSGMDRLSVAVKGQDRSGTIDSVINMYTSLPMFVEKCNNSKKNMVLLSKYNLLLCYKYADLEDWEQLQNSIVGLGTSVSNMYNKKSEFEGKEINIENINIILNEMNSATDVKDKDVFLVKYRNLMQELNML